MARNKNFWCGTGRLGADPEIRTTQSGTKVANLRVACSRDWKDRDGNKQEQTFWAPVVLWGPTADVAEQYCRKGDLVRVEGPLVNRKWTDQSGNTRHSIEINISGFNGELELLTPANRNATQPAQSRNNQRQSQPQQGGFGDDEIPF